MIPNERRLASIALCALAACASEPRVELPAPHVPQASSAPAPAASSLTAAPSPSPAPEPAPASQGPDPAKVGEMCGGFAGIACERGLVCGNVMPVPDGSGTCRKANK